MTPRLAALVALALVGLSLMVMGPLFGYDDANDTWIPFAVGGGVLVLTVVLAVLWGRSSKRQGTEARDDVRG